ncbi:MAG: NADP-dependent oxidoreductase [Deltaproteobacteria bacterium]|nr:NADP-dependent oxidoreductase [Deltaproteobacteria bacterium]
MRLHAYGGAEHLHLDVVPRPEPGPGQVLLRVRAAAINPVDWKIRQGNQRAVVPLKLPAILGMDVSGEVVELGPEVGAFQPGDEVFCSPHHTRQGGYADYVVVNADEVAHKPPSLTHVEAASIPLAGLTAWVSLVEKGELQEGQRVFIQSGAGGVGSLAIQLASHLGAEVTTTCSARNADFVRSLGATTVVDYREQRFDEVVRDQDLVLDTMGGEVLRRSVICLRRGGILVTINTGLPRAVRLFGPWLGVLAVAWQLFTCWVRARMSLGVRFRLAVRPASGERLERLGALFESGTLKPVVGSVYPLERVAEAHAESEAGHSRGKIVLDLDV